MFDQKLVHLDLKGAPPNISYLIKIIPILKSLGTTGLLIEYEDMFPYYGFLSSLKSPYHYKEEDLRLLFEACILNKLNVIPLVQSLGHLEYVLKNIEFNDLREIQNFPNVICPTNKKSLRLIIGMIEQLISIHSKYIDIKYIHLGCDEVWYLSNCTQCINKCIESQWSKEHIFLNFISKLADTVQKNYNFSPIIWDDMLRPISHDLIKSFNLTKVLHIMVWHYADIQHFQLADNNLWSKYLNLFENIWIASAFKGSTNVDQILPPIDFHINNQIAWIQILKDFVFNKSHYKQNIKGIALTGWQRFDHMMTLCELLPPSIPSLAVCLQVLEKNCFNEEAHQTASEVLGFNKIIPLNFFNSDIYANYPGSQLFCLTLKLLECKNDFKVLRKHPSLKGGFTEYLVQNNRTNPLHINAFLNNAKLLLARYEYLLTNFEIELKQIFNKETIKEWLQNNIKLSLNKLNKLITDCDQQLVLNSFS